MPAYSSSSSESASVFERGSVTLAGPDGQVIPVAVELARTQAQHAQGLMFREHLDADTGMLFEFDQERVLTFWMKNTVIPLDVLFFNASGQFLSVSTMTPCTVDPCPMYSSRGEAGYALEMNAGFAQKHRIGTGWTLGGRQ